MLVHRLLLPPSFMFALQQNFISLCTSLALSKSVEFYLRSFLLPNQAAILRARPNILIRLLQFGIMRLACFHHEFISLCNLFVFKICCLLSSQHPIAR